MNKISPFILLLLLSVAGRLGAATCISTGNGNWANASTWSCGFVPGCGDSIVIMAAHTVTITNQQNYEGCSSTTGTLKITVYGTLQFNTGSKLSLPCNSRLYVMQGGQVVPGNGGGNSNYIEICNDVYWNASQGPYSGPGCMPPNHPSCSAVMPIQLAGFQGRICEKAVCLEWQTMTEQNNDYFNIQRSRNGVEFEPLFSVSSKAANGSSQQKLEYAAVDENPVSGVSYYRLKQVDRDQSFSYSPVVVVDLDTERNIRFVIYPNPNSGEFIADLSGLSNNHEVKVVLKSMRGRVVYESSFFTQGSNSTFHIVPESKLPGGIYVCSLYLEEIEFNVKVVVESN